MRRSRVAALLTLVGLGIAMSPAVAADAGQTSTWCTKK